MQWHFESLERHFTILLYTFFMEGISTEKSLMGGKNLGSDASCFFCSTCPPGFLYAYHNCGVIVELYTSWQDLAFSLTVFWGSYDKNFCFTLIALQLIRSF